LKISGGPISLGRDHEAAIANRHDPRENQRLVFVATDVATDAQCRRRDGTIGVLIFLIFLIGRA
jgi:hypothetical protein